MTIQFALFALPGDKWPEKGLLAEKTILSATGQLLAGRASVEPAMLLALMPAAQASMRQRRLAK
jgi:hypothetical protein